MGKRCTLVCLFAMLLIGCGSKLAPPTAVAPAWVEFTHEAGRYRVELPGTPKESVKNVTSAVGEMKLTSNSVETPGQRKTFAVMFMDYPPNAKYDEEQPAQQFLDDLVAGTARGLKGSVDKKSRVKLGTHHGQEFTIVLINSGELLQGRMYLVHNRLYQVLSGWSEANGETADDAERFIHSFRLTK